MPLSLLSTVGFIGVRLLGSWGWLLQLTNTAAHLWIQVPQPSAPAPGKKELHHTLTQMGYSFQGQSSQPRQACVLASA